MKIFGLDISLDHSGLVVLDSSGAIFNYNYFTTVKKLAEVDPNHSVLLSKRGKDESKDTFRLRRMSEYLSKFLEFERRTSLITPSIYFSIEGYSYNSKTTSICQIAELTGYLKNRIFEGEDHIRIHDPLSVKLFAVGKGNCMKKDVVNKALMEFDIPEGLIKKKQVDKKDGKIEEFAGPATDLADAYFLARMVYRELQLRRGEVTLKQLDEGERRIFLRVTKAHPVNVLDRPFIHKGGDENV